MKFDFGYFLLVILLFFIELFIAVYIHDDIVRPYFGDFLVVVLMYCFVKSFFNLSVFKSAILVLLISYSIEMLQYLNIIQALGLERSTIAKIIIGHSFSWIDILSYTAGIVAVIGVEYILKRKFEQ